MRRNKKEIPRVFINVERPLTSNMFGSNKDIVLLPNKSKLENVTFHNLIKGGGDFG